MITVWFGVESNLYNLDGGPRIKPVLLGTGECWVFANTGHNDKVKATIIKNGTISTQRAAASQRNDEAAAIITTAVTADRTPKVWEWMVFKRCM
jgi:hypothetical protein